MTAYRQGVQMITIHARVTAAVAALPGMAWMNRADLIEWAALA